MTASHVLEALGQQMPERYKMTIHKTNFDVHWASPGAENDEIYEILKNKQMVNRYPNIKELGRKDTF